MAWYVGEHSSIPLRQADPRRFYAKNMQPPPTPVHRRDAHNPAGRTPGAQDAHPLGGRTPVGAQDAHPGRRTHTRWEDAHPGRRTHTRGVPTMDGGLLRGYVFRVKATDVRFVGREAGR